MSTASQLPLEKRESASHSSIVTQGLWIAGFAAATALGARLEIPHQPVPYTLQTMIVLLAGAFLGARNGAFSQILYLAAGLAGAPAFAGGAFGPAVLAGPTGGYLLAFPLAAAIVGLTVPRGASLLRTFLGMTLGLVAIFTAGTIQLYALYLREVRTALTSGFLLFTWWDLLKLGAAATIYREIGKRWPRIP